MRVDPDTRARLLALARAAVTAQVSKRQPPAIPWDVLVDCSGVFVSLHAGERLRGCLGTLGDAEPLAQAVARLAAAVCHQDPRFAPVTPAEVDALTVEISVLTPRVPLADVTALEVGRHGVVVEQGWRHGLLLPQVALEHGWDARALLEHTCLKADLPRDAWRNGADVCVFEADVFAEERAGRGGSAGHKAPPYESGT